MEWGQDFVETMAQGAEILGRQIAPRLRPLQPEAIQQPSDLIEVPQQGDRGRRLTTLALLEGP